MSRATGDTADNPRIRTELGMVRLSFVYYEACYDRTDVVVTVYMYGPYGPGGQPRSYRVFWDDQGNARTTNSHYQEGRRKKVPETIETCADRVVDEYLRQNPGWLKAQLSKDLVRARDRNWNHWIGDLRDLINQVRCCAHWSSTYGESLLGKSPAEWAEVLKSIEDFHITIARHAGFEDVAATAPKPKLMRAA